MMPVHFNEVARRIREAFGLKQTGSRILARVTDGLLAQKRAGGVHSSGDSWQERWLGESGQRG